MAKKRNHNIDTDEEFEFLSKYMTYYINYLYRKAMSKTGKIKECDTFETWKLKKVKPKKTGRKTIKVSNN